MKKKINLIITEKKIKYYKEQKICHICEKKFCMDKDDETYKNRRLKIKEG